MHLSDESDYAVVLENKLLIGDIKFSKDIRSLKKIKIDAVVDLCHYKDIKSRVKYSHEMDILYYPVHDTPTNNIEWAEEGSKWIENEISKGKKVFVHCYYGISRSSTLVLHYLMTRCGMKLKDAFDFLKAKRPIVCPTFGFMKGLSELDYKLYNEYTLPIRTYAINCIKESFPSVSAEEIEATYDESERKIKSEGDEMINKLKEKVKFEEIEPTGYVCIELLKTKYNLVKREGCVEHHPFE